jgi:hypothetical protein
MVLGLYKPEGVVTKVKKIAESIRYLKAYTTEGIDVTGRGPEKAIKPK